MGQKLWLLAFAADLKGAMWQQASQEAADAGCKSMPCIHGSNLSTTLLL